MNKPIVETIEEEYTMKYVFNNAKELFLTTKVYVKAQNIDYVMKLHVDNVKPMFDAPQEQRTTKMKDHIHNINPVTPVGLTKTLSPDFLYGKD